MRAGIRLVLWQKPASCLQPYWQHRARSVGRQQPSWVLSVAAWVGVVGQWDAAPQISILRVMKRRKLQWLAS